MLEPWLAQIDAHEKSLADAADRGRQRQPPDDAAGGQNRGSPNARSRSRGRSRPRSRSQSRHGRRRHDRRRRHRRRSTSSSDSDSESDSSADEAEGHAKRRKLDPSLFDWEVNRTIQNAVLSPAHLAVKRRYENFSADPKECLRLIKNSHPPPFTDNGLRAIVYGSVVNFDEVHSYFNSPSVPTTVTHSLGNGLVFQTAETSYAHKVVNRDNWKFVWDKYEEILNHIFNGRQAELRRYYKFINNLFQRRHPSMDPQVIVFEKACRAHIASSRGTMLFNDIHEFIELKESYLEVTGLAYVAPPGEAGTSGSSREGGRPKKRRREICRNWNGGRCSADDCRYRHVCSNCKSNDHSSKSCPSRNTGKSV
ncbi:uncharacterized protein EV420DRAFT_1270178 [Desarmillaria tabescens]|uniref:C3H1-type domain-containing protein n=1 Tax=Armillaria tabescens TaxID=1929756 RepID=A0AA39N5T4_ARMTA|nr:uncharacterized protein EV420DRAFT_1270178 [Desarmillaria tabescens]KAK0458972.1 hypothetical protein EV420DRAFT_1270178 [Desarmillaria tabescens]